MVAKDSGVGDAVAKSSGSKFGLQFPDRLKQVGLVSLIERSINIRVFQIKNLAFFSVHQLQGITEICQKEFVKLTAGMSPF